MGAEVRCPRCGGPAQDLRGMGFDPAKVEGCFLYNKGDSQCRARRRPVG